MKKIDVHCHFGSWQYAIPPGDAVERLLRLSEREDLRYMACSSAPALLYDMVSGNAEMVEAIENHEQLLGYVYVNPVFLPESIDELERYLDLDSMVGAKIHPRLSGTALDHPAMADLVAEVAQRADVLLVHTVDQHAAHQMGEYARKYRNLSIILGHAGHTDSDEAARVAECEPNIYIEFCCEWPGAGKIERALDICGPGSICFGSDSDLLDTAFTLGMYEGADLTHPQKQLIYWDNAARLFGMAAR
jgi:predicted TIM-barrel fold metal-dependent hydrolase